MLNTNSLVLRAVCFNAFGRNDGQKFWQSILKLVLAMGIMISIGAALGVGVARAPLPNDIPLTWLLSSLTLVSYIISGMIFFAFASSRDRTSRSLMFQRQISLLPLSQFTFWLSRILPHLLIYILLLCFFVPIVLGLSRALEVSSIWMALVVGIGILAGFSITLFYWPQRFAGRAGLFIASILLSLRLIEYGTTTNNHNLLITLTCLILLLAQSGLIQSYYSRLKTIENGTTIVHILLSGAVLRGFWFIAKVLRNPRTKLGLLFCLVLSFLLAIAIFARHLTSTSPDWLLIGGLISAAFTCDIRGISSRYKAPEIYAVGGVKRFACYQLIAVLAAGYIIGSPILIMYAFSGEITTHLIIVFFCLQAGCSVIGLLAGTIFLTNVGNVGAQFLAATLSTALVLGLPRLFHFADYHIATQSCMWLLVATGCFLISYGYEKRRQQSYGCIRT